MKETLKIDNMRLFPIQQMPSSDSSTRHVNFCPSLETDGQDTFSTLYIYFLKMMVNLHSVYRQAQFFFVTYGYGWGVCSWHSALCIRLKSRFLGCCLFSGRYVCGGVQTWCPCAALCGFSPVKDMKDGLVAT